MPLVESRSGFSGPVVVRALGDAYMHLSCWQVVPAQQSLLWRQNWPEATQPHLFRAQGPVQQSPAERQVCPAGTQPHLFRAQVPVQQSLLWKQN